METYIMKNIRYLLTKEQIELLTYVQGLFKEKIFLVGGSVRDILLGKEVNDYDFCSAMTTDEVKECLKGKHRAYLIGERFGTIGFICLGQKIEITRFREEEYATHSRKPNVTFGTDLRTDLSRRDFCINAMAYDCCKYKLIDYFDGQKDLEEGILRAVGSPRLRFKEDPLRLLRCIRFATTLGFEIEENTLKKLKEMTYSLMRISRERWVEEFDKILKSDNVARGLRMLWEYRVFNFTIPELSLQWNYDQNSRYHNLQLWEHTTKVVESAQKAGEPIEMIYSALWHDIGKPFCRVDKDVPEDQWEEYGKKKKSNYVFHEKLGAEIASRLCDYLKFSNKRKDYVVDMIKNHLKDDCPLRVYDNLHKSKCAIDLDNRK